RGKNRLKWTPGMLGLERFPHLIRSLAWYDISADSLICNLDDPSVLLAERMRPSQVISRDYDQSQAWALRLYQQNRWSGVSWWSFNDARWTSMGLWNLESIERFGVEPLGIDHPAFAEAARVLDVRIDPMVTKKR
ncbi:MAG: hypothetical protein M3N19_12070, partial [Candidatus Eremiobacteraeota bacterium]|nr:hypothetical protein [Candidatus Eremiobacteraeota bacterium]